MFGQGVNELDDSVNLNWSETSEEPLSNICALPNFDNFKCSFASGQKNSIIVTKIGNERKFV